MSITKEDVKYIAALARIDMPEDKLEGMTKILGDIVHYVEQLQKLDVDNVKPTSHAVPVGNVLRPDVVRPSKAKHETLFKVPLIIE